MKNLLKGNRYIYDILNEGLFDSNKIHTDLKKLLDKKYGIDNSKDKEYTNMKRNPLLLKDMDVFLQEIKKIRDEKKNLIIFGDYDVDGITGVAILIKGLRAFGISKDKIDYILPDRDVGYSIHKEYVEKYLENPQRRLKNIDYIITVDCGTNSVSEVEKITKELGIQVGISDHHHITVDLKDSKARFIINQHRKDDNFPYKNISGSFIALKMMEAIKNKFMIFPNVSDSESLMSELEDLATLGSVADVMPILDENFFLVKSSLKRFYQSKNPAIRYMTDKMGQGKDVSVDTSIIGFNIGPKLNAGGRLETAEHGLKMLLVSDEVDCVKTNQENNTRIIKELYDNLSAVNERRKSMVEEVMKGVIENTDLKHKGAVFCDRNINDGIIGLIAGRLKEQVLKPSICITKNVVNALILAEEYAKINRDDSILDALLLNSKIDLMNKDHLIQRRVELIKQGKNRVIITEKEFYEKMSIITNKYNDSIYKTVVEKQNPNVIVDEKSILMYAIEKKHLDVALLFASFDKTNINIEQTLVAKCSGRSIETVNLINIIHLLKDYFVGYGGHDYAFGGTIKSDKVDEFIKAFHQVCDKNISDSDLCLTSEIFAEINGDDFNHSVVSINKNLSAFGPFGKSRESPAFMYTGVIYKVEETQGKNGNIHTYVHFNDSSDFKFAWWNTGGLSLENGDRISIIGAISTFPKRGGGCTYTVTVSDYVKR